MPIAASPAPRRALVVVNPTAGTLRSGVLEQVLRLCRQHLQDVAVHRTTHRGSAAEAVRAALAPATAAGAGVVPDLVVAVGGDGTVHEVVRALAAADAKGAPGAGRSRAGAALAIVPAGTGNSGYRMLWAEQPWHQSLRATVTGDPARARLRRVDLGRLEETGGPVLLGACSGLIAQGLIAARSVAAAGREKYARALPDAAASFTPYPGRVTVDGQLLHEGATVLANVGGGRHRGGQYLVLPRSELDDGLLDVCVVGDEVAPAEVADLARAGLLHTRAGVVHGRGRRIRVERTDGLPLLFEHDGELQPLGFTSMTVGVLPGALAIWGAPREEETRVDTQGAVPLGGVAAP
ncbi:MULTISPECIES: diacylglycerol/lipid kinase family protein [Streptomyces]|uniref:diacylglycerol/lipid kinase family protein n=1 Tax=Streptomyces TaxID=1883 RepID=UPI0013DB59C6|nr:diacylglycerol kinase family protein [Streptomyces aureoverticillatus]QIB41708.1 diacylglycerol kinase [Streptomyces aureoverticillatus]QIB48430.1 diacylglycerol kinase [Streptomyces aureoverticillatus]